MQKESIRQLIHASGVFVVILSYFINTQVLILLLIAIVVFMEIMFRLDKNHNVFIFSTIFRLSKRRDDERGFAYFFTAIILTLFIFQFNLAVADAAILILLFGDSASTLIGRKFGRFKLPLHKKKTLEGSLAFLIVGFAVALTQVPLSVAFLGALSGAITEAYSPVDDNIPIPLVSALIMTLAFYLL